MLRRDLEMRKELYYTNISFLLDIIRNNIG